jgi:hypothetical protein
LALAERVLQEKPAVTTATQWSAELLRSLWMPQDQVRKQLLDASTAAGDAITLKMFQSANDQQRKHLSEKLRGYAKDVQQWSRSPIKGAWMQYPPLLDDLIHQTFLA